jgi:2-haloacid dehalogenase
MSFDLSRRAFVQGMALAAFSAPLAAHQLRRIRALAFDAFVLFDPGSVLAHARSLVGAKGDLLVKTAATRIFAYSWYLTSAERYQGFEALADAAFRYAAEVNGLALADNDYRQLVGAYSDLKIWPDVPAALDLLSSRGIRLALLSNLSTPMLESNLRANGIAQRFEAVLSTDLVRKFKPAPEAYELGVKAFGLLPSEIGFAASAGWDASGATWFGYETAWINRNHDPLEGAHAAPAIIAQDMSGVLTLAAASADRGSVPTQP